MRQGLWARALAHDYWFLTLDTESAVFFGMQNAVGSGEGNEGVYGSIKVASVLAIIDALRSALAPDHVPVVADFGGGIGRCVC